MRSFVGRAAKQAVSAACNSGSITPATFDATLSCKSKTSFSEPSKVGPEMRAGISIDQLSANTDTVASFAHRAFEHVLHAKPASDLLQSGD